MHASLEEYRLIENSHKVCIFWHFAALLQRILYEKHERPWKVFLPIYGHACIVHSSATTATCACLSPMITRSSCMPPWWRHICTSQDMQIAQTLLEKQINSQWSNVCNESIVLRKVSALTGALHLHCCVNVIGLYRRPIYANKVKKV